jgi:disulfide bond formation protein DsbB
MLKVPDFAARHGLALGLTASALMLAIAHAFEAFGHLAPCHMCLQQRDAYWGAMLAAAAGLAAARLQPRLRPIFLWLLAIIFLVGGGVAVWQAGAEWGFWKAPESCAGVARASAADLVAMLNGARLAPPRCDVAAWRLFGVSMAGYNAVVSLGLALFSVLAARSARPVGA